MKKLKKKISIAEVARACGVGTTTVSRVINNQVEVAEATREHVQEVIRKMGYIPSVSARQMVHGGNQEHPLKTRTIAVVDCFERNTTVAHAEIVNALVKGASGMGYRTVIAGPSQAPDSEPFDGYLLLNDMRIRTTKPCVTVDWISDDKAIPGVLPDYKDGAITAMETAFAQGFCSPMLLGPASQRDTRDFTSLIYQGFAEVIRKHGRDPETSVLDGPVFTKEKGYAIAKELLARPDAPDLLLASDDAAIGVYRAASEMGRKIGADLGVIGCDGISLAAYLQPALATIDIDISQLARQALQRLLALIEDRPGPYPQQYLMPAEFVPRNSINSYLG